MDGKGEEKLSERQKGITRREAECRGTFNWNERIKKPVTEKREERGKEGRKEGRKEDERRMNRVLFSSDSHWLLQPVEFQSTWPRIFSRSYFSSKFLSIDQSSFPSFREKISTIFPFSCDTRITLGSKFGQILIYSYCSKKKKEISFERKF